MVIHNTDIMSEDFIEDLEVHDAHKQGVSKRKTREMMGHNKEYIQKKKKPSRDTIRNHLEDMEQD